MTGIPLPKTKRGRERRARLLAAAETVIGEKGYAAATIVDITSAAETALGTFYVYFASKEEIFRELVLEMGQATRTMTAEAIADAPDRIVAERLGLEAFLRFVSQRPSLYRVVEEARFAAPDAYRSYFTQFGDAYMEGLEIAQKNGEIVPGDSEVRAWALMGMAKALGDRYVLWDDTPDISKGCRRSPCADRQGPDTMTSLVSTDIRMLPSGAQCCVIRMTAPRANALEPGLLNALHAAFDVIADAGCPTALLCGGRNFSSGGDVARFLDAVERGDGPAYGEAVVGSLQYLVRRMLTMPVIFATAARGAVTGGSAGFLFGADLVALAPDAFVQPYYAQVGFAPDGGWTAVLPEKIGPSAAMSWLKADRRRTAAGLLASGLADYVECEPEEFAVQALSEVDVPVALASKTLIWDVERLAVISQRLDAEKAAFQRLLRTQRTRSKMLEFLGKTEAEHV